MKTSASIFAIIAATLLQIGCATAPQTEAVQAAAVRSEYDGINKDSQFFITFPASRSGPFSSVDLLNFQIANGEFKDNDMSAIVGKSRKTGEWEVLMLFSNKDGNWVMLPKNK